MPGDIPYPCRAARICVFTFLLKSSLQQWGRGIRYQWSVFAARSSGGGKGGGEEGGSGDDAEGEGETGSDTREKTKGGKKGKRRSTRGKEGDGDGVADEDDEAVYSDAVEAKRLDNEEGSWTYAENDDTVRRIAEVLHMAPSVLVAANKETYAFNPVKTCLKLRRRRRGVWCVLCVVLLWLHCAVLLWRLWGNHRR